jgi:hypothetical protein
MAHNFEQEVVLRESVGAIRRRVEALVRANRTQLRLSFLEGTGPLRLQDHLKTRVVHLLRLRDDVEQLAYDDLVQVVERDHPWLLVQSAGEQPGAAFESRLRRAGYRRLSSYAEGQSRHWLFGHRPESGAQVPPDSALSLIAASSLRRLPPTHSVVAGLASVAGNEQALRATVASLLPQVDRLFVYLNRFREVPRFLKDHPRITACIDTDGQRYGDAGKFWGLEQVHDSIYLTCDDDIIYPIDFVASMVRELAQVEATGAVGVHGSLLLQPSMGYYAPGSRVVFHFESSLPRRRRVHILGTAACAFHTRVVRAGLGTFEAPNMADIWFARYLQRKGLPAWVIPRPAGWLRSIEVRRPTIYSQSVARSGCAYDSSSRQDEVLAEMVPLSILGATRWPERPVVSVVQALGAKGLARFIEGIAAGKRDPIVIVVCDAASPSLRHAALSPSAAAEVHVVDGTHPRKPAYADLLEQARDKVLCFTLDEEGNAQPAEAFAWRRWLR